ncbi:MAG TPA: uracil-DNA glycosylase [Roseomonas sp.]|jgi:uracil-DNA glycosylase
MPASAARSAARTPRLRPYAGALSDPQERAARHALLRDAVHTAPIRALAQRIREATGRPVPEPDPLDGGAEARLLLLLETPGPRMMEDSIVSRDKPGGTGANLRRFLDAARIPRRETLIWNAVPWMIHVPGALNRAPRAAELRFGLAWIPPLLDAMPRLRVAVLAGRVAAEAGPAIRSVRPGLSVLAMPHPSPTYVCTSPEVPARIMVTLKEAAARLRGEAS